MDHSVPDNPADYLVSITNCTEGLGAVMFRDKKWWHWSDSDSHFSG
jgi:hypothetical protein